MMRCLALAQAWQTHGGGVSFLSHCDNDALRRRVRDAGMSFISIGNPYPDDGDLPTTLSTLSQLTSMDHDAPPWLVLDGYHFDPVYHHGIRAAGFRLLVMDDCAHLPRYHADALLNQNVYAEDLRYQCDQDTILLLGTRYVLLRPEFLTWRGWKRDIPDAARKVLVTLGGSDPDNVTLKVIEGLQQVGVKSLEVKVIVGPANAHHESLRRAAEKVSYDLQLLSDVMDMPALMAWSDVAISACGTTSWELAFMGLPSIALVLADNQELAARVLNERRVVLSLGNGASLQVESIRAAVLQLLTDRATRQAMSEGGQLLVDGRGAERVVTKLSHKDFADAFLMPWGDSDA